MTLRKDAEKIIGESLKKVMPDQAVSKALLKKTFSNGRIYLVSVGKAAWQMAKTASDILKDKIADGICITKYGHVKDEIEGVRCYEAGHPIPDENAFIATQKVLDLVSDLSADDTVVFLLSGGGSALFEKPLIQGEELADITKQLLACGAEITEMNTIRKRLSAVKGGRFAMCCAPANVYSIVLSDIIGDPLDMIASGPSYPDFSTSEQAVEIIRKYNLKLSEHAMKCILVETPKELSNVETVITGSVSNLCSAVADSCKNLGYIPTILTDRLSCEAREAGTFMANIAQTHYNSNKSLAFIAGGETVVHLNGKGKGGRNQELALACAVGISGLENVAIFSVGSDGTDGPTDAAGGYCDGYTLETLKSQGIDVYDALSDNNAYYTLQKSGGLIKTGPTGTNVNDVSVILIKKQ